MPYMKEFPLDSAVVASSIYGTFTHQVTSVGVVLESTIKSELERFQREYTSFLGVADGEKFFRVDLYFDSKQVFIIEVNVEVADGWGVSLNLLRAAGIPLVMPAPLPVVIPTYPEDPRETEYCLAISECARLGVQVSLEVHPKRLEDPLDNKRHLAQFSTQWQSDLVAIPVFYEWRTCHWNQLPKEVYFKRVDGRGPKSVQVVPRSSCVRRNDFRSQYRRGKVIVQAQVEPFLTEEGEPVQAVLMCAGGKVVTGYVQIAPRGRTIINDKGTKKGPLMFI